MMTVFVSNNPTSKNYHTSVCGNLVNNLTEIEASEPQMNLLKTLGYTLCVNCKRRQEAKESMLEHVMFLEALELKRMDIPDDYELRVYWHNPETKTPKQLWSSRNGVVR